MKEGEENMVSAEFAYFLASSFRSEMEIFRDRCDALKKENDELKLEVMKWRTLYNNQTIHGN